MECENKEELVSDSSSTIESVSFLQVTAVASGWMLDFMFVSLCRSFKEGNFDEFNENLSVFQALSQCKSLEEAAHKEKSLICAFLARVMHGKQLDVVFEEDESVMPLMSAATVWSSLENSVEDESLFKNITVLLFVQAVAVCLEKGQRASASSVLKWFEKRHAFPRNLGVKLSTVVTKAETYHPFLMNFSFNRLLETIQSFLDNYLKKNPSDFLIKAATKIVQSSQSIKDSKPVEVQDSTVSEKPKETTQKETTQKNKKTKCKLLYTKIPDLWTPETMKKPCVSVRRLSRNGETYPTCFYLANNKENCVKCFQHTVMSMVKSRDFFNLPPSELCQLTMRKTLENSPLKKNEKHKKRKTPKKWTPQLDKYLKEGVKRHGQGNWSRILLDYDFEGRTGTMLKDRWRVLLRAHKVG